MSTLQHEHFSINNFRWHWLLPLGVLAWAITQLPLPLLVATSVALITIPFLLHFPWLLWPLIAVLLPLTSGIKIGAFSASEGMLTIAGALWFADGVRRRTIQSAVSLPALAALTYATFLFLVLLNALNFAEALAEMLKWIEFALVIVLVQASVPAQQRGWLVIGLLTGGVLQSLLGIYQFIFRIGPDWFLFLGRYMRAYGSFSQPNPFAGYLGLTLPVALSLALWGMKGWEKGRKGAGVKGRLDRSPFLPFSLSPFLWLIVGLASSGLISLGLLLSWSRGGWLGGLAAIIVVLFLRSRLSVTVGVLFASIAIGFILAGSINPAIVPQPIADRLANLPSYFGLSDVLSQPVTDENFAVVERVAHWAAAMRMWQSAPWLGVGPGNYAIVYPIFKVPGWDEALGHAHNIYLNLLAETGLLGLLSYLLFWFVLIGWTIRQWQSAKANNEDWQAALLLGLLGAITHLTIHNLFDNLYVQGIYLHLALWIAAVGNYKRGLA